MSTRACIARVGKHEGEFEGRYSHWDGYPTALGRSLFQMLHGHFKNNLPAILQVLIDEHTAGWSNLVDRNWKKKPGYSNDLQSDAPACYCHGKRHEPAQQFTHADLKENNAGLEWLYVFDESERKLFVREVSTKEDVAVIDLNGEQPDWSKVECGDNFERCLHYAWYHNLLPKTSNLGTQTWLGNRPLEFHDAVAFIVGGKRYKATGSGGNSNYLHQMTGKNLPPDVWVSSVISGNGKRLELPVAKITKEDGSVPLPGVQWVMPQTKNNPQETLVSA